MDINISQCNKETMINGFAARKHDVATLKEALQIARAAIKDIQKDLCRRNRRVKTDEGYEQIWHVNKGDDFNATLKTCTFADGTPFGIKEE